MIKIEERFQIKHWDDVACKLDRTYSIQDDYKLKGKSTFNSFILYEVLKKIYESHPGIDSYEGAMDISIELWEPNEGDFPRLIIQMDGHKYIIAPKIPGWL